MQRLTIKQEDGSYAVKADALEKRAGGVYGGEAVELLAAFENAVEVAQVQEASAAKRLEALKVKGQIRSATAQQLLAQKLTYSTMLHMMGVDE